MNVRAAISAAMGPLQTEPAEGLSVRAGHPLQPPFANPRPSGSARRYSLAGPVDADGRLGRRA
jgi:hypothetical protein